MAAWTRWGIGLTTAHRASWAISINRRPTVTSGEAHEDLLDTTQTSADRAVQVELAVLDAAEECRPGDPAEDEGEAVGVVTVPHRNPAGAVGQCASLNAASAAVRTIAADPPGNPSPIIRPEDLALVSHPRSLLMAATNSADSAGPSALFRRRLYTRTNRSESGGST